MSDVTYIVRTRYPAPRPLRLRSGALGEEGRDAHQLGAQERAHGADARGPAARVKSTGVHGWTVVMTTVVGSGARRGPGS